MPAREKTLADGQLDDASATILAGSSISSVSSRRVAVILNNVTSSTMDVYVLFQRAGGTARRLTKFQCQGNKGYVVRGIAMETDDTLLAYADNADSVDYLVTADGRDVPFSVSRLDGDNVLDRMEEYLMEVAHGA